MHILYYLSSLISAVSVLALPASNHASSGSAWPYGPFSTCGNTIVDASGNPVTYVGVNWPGHGEAMIPEGLQYQSISDIVSRIKSLNMNVIRLTYAIEMIDDILDSADHKTDVAISDAFTRALGSENGTAVLTQILQHNPQFTASTTRLEVFNAVAEECHRQQVLVHVDNHMSQGAWCCSLNDGNGWFGDTYFDAARWRRGLAFMAGHIKSTPWSAAVSMSLRNELRNVQNNSAVNATVNWSTWYDNVLPAAAGIHRANPDLLIFFSGLNYDTQLGPVVRGEDLGDRKRFDKNSLAYAEKLVFELHNYQNSATNCTSIQSGLYDQGYSAMDVSTGTPVTNIAPVVMTEFGFEQNATEYLKVYAQCLKEWVTEKVPSFSKTTSGGGWMQWVIVGSYYMRQGMQDFDESWGLLNHNWTNWRSDEVVENYLKPMVAAT